MANSRRQSSKVNAGSMADIAFLLLIFFLVVSTIEEDVGINRKLPKWCETGDCNIETNPRNLFTINLSKNNELLVNDALLPLTSLKQKVKDFVDNNGDQSCAYCNGKQLASSSDNPSAAIISILSSREANYEDFIKVQDELVEAYSELRTDYIRKKFGKPISKLNSDELKLIKEAYPFQVSEADLKL
jgi:biopolymer transport protein ExbD